MAEPISGPRTLSPRQIELAVRARNQRARVGSQRWGGVPAWMNRRTGKPHEHNRAKARRQARISTDPNWPVVAGRV